MKVVVTPEANAFIHTNILDPGLFAMIGEAMSFQDSLEHRRCIALSKVSPGQPTRSVTYRCDGQLALCFWLEADKVLLFIPLPYEQRGAMGKEYLEKEFARSTELNIT